MNTSKGTEEVKEQGATETKVEAMDYRSQAGQDRETTKENVNVVHLHRDKGRSSVGGGAMSGAAAAVANTLRSAKDAIFGSGKDTAKK